jgi:hypothetical protein
MAFADDKMTRSAVRSMLVACPYTLYALHTSYPPHGNSLSAGTYPMHPFAYPTTIGVTFMPPTLFSAVAVRARSSA